MILFPAIDLKDGQCVRLVRGDMACATVFNDDPGAQARAFQDLGFEYLHLVDLNGAFAGRPVNADAVEAILAAITVPAQLGGGIRDLATIEAWLDLTAAELAARFEDAGVAAIIYTDIDRDGVLEGLNLAATSALARATAIPVIASGGLSSMDDITALLKPEHGGLAGVVSGRALYDGRLDAAAALALIAASRHGATVQ
jgi:phosphoribosylformimino-5-aminoimidazole carboxamide ribotide isomerase